MAELKIERTLNAPIEKVFSFVSKSENLAKWWGPEGMTLPDAALDFSQTGPWHSVMENADGQKFKVSGQVTSVKAPSSVGFTWAWHGDNDQRGEDSHVSFVLVDNGDNTTTLTLHHQQLATEETAESHIEGWTSSLRKLERMAA
jgi:uncharacterized protein YndB with AHSA1/START domain